MPPGAETRLDILDREVTLTLASKTGTSALNTLAGTVAGVEARPDRITVSVRITIAGAGEIDALVTRRSFVALGLTEGLPVLARFKAEAVQ